MFDINKKQLSYKDVFNTLPHRFPFLLVDKVLDLKRGDARGLGDEIVAQKNVTFNEPYFQGHFPEMPIMPGVLVIESMAQACGMMAYRPHPSGTAEKWKFFILGIDGARFRKPIVPGDVLELKCKCIKVKSVFYTFDCKVYCDGELKAEAEIFAQMMP
ncbi:MAG: 3-hydroxyacyl-ACP dehydratase FabZ [Bdellovibrionota bacterium]